MRRPRSGGTSGGASRRADVAKGVERISPHRKKYWRSAGYFAHNFKEKPNLSKNFFLLLIYKKSKRKNFLRILLNKFSKTVFTPFFANTLLYDVFISILLFQPNVQRFFFVSYFLDYYFHNQFPNNYIQEIFDAFLSG